MAFKATVDKCPVVIGAYYKRPDGVVVLVYGAGRGRVLFHTEDSGGGADYREASRWAATNLQDFPNAKDPRLPYVFDLHFDIKYTSELRRELGQPDCDPYLRKLAKDHGLS